VGDGFPDNLAIVGDAFLKSCKLLTHTRTLMVKLIRSRVLGL
jgi:hypothetical protein